MLRITVTRDAHLTRIVLEGRLVEAFVDPLQDCWLHELAKREPGSICVDLAEVLSLDAAGRRMLRSLHEQGAQLCARDPWMRATLEEIVTAEGG